MKIAVIPARGGSKRIPHKNIRSFCGQPMIAWSIQIAQKSGLFDKIIVSTDDQEIATQAIHFGALVPFIRPSKLSNDTTGIKPVIAHTIRELDKCGESAQFVCCIFATAPFICQNDLSSALNELNDDSIDFSFPVARFTAPIQRAIKIDETGRAGMFNPEAFLHRSQDLEPAYHDAGQFYWGKSHAWLNDGVMFSSISRPIVIPSYRVQDIDSEEDWTRAEIMFKAIHDV
jgi:pseudaminic acid cytidylyltransferase